MAKGLVVGNLRVALGLDTAEFDDGVARVNRDSKGLANNLRTGLSTAAAAVSGAAIGMGAALAGIGFAGVIAAVRNTAAEMATLSDEAKRSGLSLQAFQEWKFVAEQNRIGLDAMVDGFKELSLRADEFTATGGGSAAEAFQRLGYGAEDLKEKLKDPSALMLEIIDRLGTLDKAAQIRIFDELLGGSGGEQFVQLIDQGSAGLQKTIDRAHELGRVVSDDVVKSAIELDKQFREVSSTVDTYLKTAIVNSASALQNFLEMLKKPEDRQLEAVRDRLKEIDEIASSSGMRLAAYQTQYGGAGLPWLKQEREELEMIVALREQSQKIQFGGNLPAPGSGAPGSKTPAAPSGGSASTQADPRLGELQSLQEQLRTDEEAELASYERRKEVLDWALEDKQLTVDSYNELAERAQQEHTDRMANIAAEGVDREARIRSQLVGYAADTFGSLADLAANFGEKGFVAAKAFGIAQAVINTAEGITKALAQGGVLGFAGAAAVAAAGAAQIATIASAQPGGSSRPSVPYSSVANAPPAGSSEGDGGGRAPAYINIIGSKFSWNRDEVRALLGEMQDLIDDGYKLEF